MLRVIPYPNARSMMNGDRPTNGFTRYNGSGATGHLQPHQQPQQQRQPAARPPSAAEISRTYKTCTNLFLTRRLPEALATLQPVVAESANPRGKCSRVLRIKVWSLYFAILDAAAKIGSEEGKKLWGAGEWRKIVQKIRTARVWDEAVNAYTNEGRVDGDVVIALVMLLLSHAADQRPTQKRLEAYMSASSSLMGNDEDPKAVAQRVKLMELYILHVLPKVDEWQYAREFTQGSNDLDDDQKAQFLATLDALFREKEEAEEHARRIEAQRDAEIESARLAAENQRSVSPSVSGSIRSSSSRQRKPSPSDSVRQRPKSRGSVSGARLVPGQMGKSSRSAEREQSKEGVVAARHQASSLFGHTQALFTKMQKAMFSAQGNGLLLRTVIMLCAVVYATSKKKVRERIKRLLMVAWLKTSRTVGMGMKVTYI
ncbi:hypothetical protein L211DRAFT_853177 [Terfezia boudieri ATCC MYA-4762]|uniref:Peroxin 26 n=1 Tax=Terfezia boudieri ATCC MYA-4762 TaxID=1051890 RepID=A0A3N4L9G6_9PEZI|nr:hypothetical protein L211DRAFT_853177 [Terfezia boudieri ATCC MYA-4762]